MTTGWYLYGITLSGSPASELAVADAEPVELLELRGLAAVVAPVPLADFSPAALRERLENASSLEATVRSHNRVVAAIHTRQAILPAKFGMVYPEREDVVSALRPAHDTLLHRLHRMAACDEWAIHLYADRSAVRERIFAEDPTVGRLRDARNAARPGRAYFLERQLGDALECATDQALSSLAQSAHDRLAGHAIASQVNPIPPDAELVDEVEILRAAFLVKRDGAERFHAEVQYLGETGERLRCASSGPWPTYSFAMHDGEEAA